MKLRKTVLITGGSKGIGQATARLLLQKGMQVILLARDVKRLAAAKKAFVAEGFTPDAIEVVEMDMGDADAIRTRVPELWLLQRGLFGLVNNAACEILKPLSGFTEDDLESTWRVNMRAPIVMIQTCYPFLKKVRGSVVNLGSVSDREHYPRYSVYGGSKAFLNAFSRHAAKELGFDGIRINVISPSGIDTPLMRAVEKTFPRKEIRQAKQAIPIGQRWGTSQEIAETIYFALTGPSYLHGADIRVHGGSE